MIHRSKDLTVGATRSSFPRAWEEPGVAEKEGMVAEGIVQQVRNHTVEDAAGGRHRYVALVVEVKSCRRRTWNDKGEEEVNQVEKTDKKKKGRFLNQYATVEVDDPFAVSSDEIVSLLGGDALPENVYPEGLSALHPSTPDRFEFWGPAKDIRPSDYQVGDRIRFRTRGFSIFLDMTAGTTNLSRNFAGEDVLGNWDNKIQGMKAAQDDGPLPGDELEGAGDDEWD
eukprot:TRINITY_DN3232_c0_g1_i1.p2 TRINITY_DN3232_c0_g1~~TRINITY_DN3232_c0_g1_i1.p2  ORF type:complete len:239 (-),score=101.43 TRINITY_DN3232_c0_g1_i1:165-842(-)